MKSMIVVLSLALLGTGLAPFDAEAKRLGGGSSAGMQRSVPPRTPPTATPTPPAQAAPTAPATAGAAPAAAAPKRSWLGPIAGLAAGLGLAALMSHLGLGAEFGNILMLALIGVVGFVAIRLLMNRFARGHAAPGTLATPNGMAFAGAGAGTSSAAAAPLAAVATPAASVSALPADFDAAAFERIAKLIFIRMQAANDASDLNDLRAFTTPEMFAAIKLDLQERGSATQTTDVVRIDAEVLDVVSEPQRRLVSVRFHGLIREDKEAAATPFDEVWHLVRPADGSHEWAIAGIQQAAAA
ncbi:MAG TPA: Tim44-like domain-containing protein [Burkholderiaceae bacterium]|nr:Tim44-like domain-containing protein [Burkholderiaceae bacterium]